MAALICKQALKRKLIYDGIMLNNMIKQIYGFLSVYCVYRKRVLEIICYYESVKQKCITKKIKTEKETA